MVASAEKNPSTIFGLGHVVGEMFDPFFFEAHSKASFFGDSKAVLQGSLKFRLSIPLLFFSMHEENLERDEVPVESLTQRLWFGRDWFNMSLVNSPLFEWFFLRLLCVDNLSKPRGRLEDEAPRLRWVHLVKATGTPLGANQLGKLSPALIFLANWDFLSNFCLNGKRDKFDRNLQVWWLMIDVCHVSVSPSNELTFT